MTQSLKRKLVSVFVSLFMLCVAILGVISLVPMLSTSAQKADKEDYALALTEYKVANYNENVTIYNPNGDEVDVENGKFFMMMAGDYVIEYSDSTTVVHALRKNPEVDFTLTTPYAESYAIGTRLELSEATITSAICDYPIYNVTIKDASGEVVDVINSTNLDSYKLLMKEEQYSIVYSCVDSFTLSYRAEKEFVVKTSGDFFININELPATVNYGTSINIGAVYAVYNGESFPVEVQITTPSGANEILDDLIYNPTENGEYTFRAHTTIDGVNKEIVQKVNVIYSSNSLIGSSSLINGVVAGVDLPEYAKEEGKSMYIDTTTDNSSVTYSKIVDLTQFTSDDPLIEFIPFSDELGYTQHEIHFTLEDAQNPANTITIAWWYRSNVSQESYITTYVKGVEYGGQKNEGKADLTVNPTYGQLRTYYGTVNYGGRFNTLKNGGKTNMFQVAYDHEEKAFFTLCDSSLKKTQIIDLDDPDVVGLTRVWNGFTSNKVYLKLTFRWAAHIRGGAYIKSIGGEEAGSALLDNPTNDTCYVMNEEYENNKLPNGAVNYGTKVPTYFVSKMTPNTVVTTKITKGDKDFTNCLVKGVFTPTEAGDYEITYSALDNYGKEIVRTYTCHVTETPTPITIANPTSAQVKSDLFAWYEIPNLAISGGAGEYKTEYVVTADGQPVEIVGNRFYVDKNAEYKVSIKVTDFINYVETMTYKLTLNTNYIAVLLEDDMRAVRAGETITFPAFTAYDYMLKKNVAKTLEVYAGGALVQTFTGDDAYTYAIPADCTDLTVKYIAGSGSRMQEKEIAMYVIPQTITDQDDFLIFDKSVERDILRQGFLYKIDEAFSISTAYAMPANGFNITFGLDGETFKNGYVSQITYTLVDSQDPSNVVEMVFSEFNPSLYTSKATINGSANKYTMKWQQGTYPANCGDATANETYGRQNYYFISLRYEDAMRAFLNARGFVDAKAEQTKDGSEFGGFRSGLLYAKLSVDALSAPSKFLVSTIANQNFTYTINSSDNYVDKDNAGPNIWFSSPMASGYYEIGDTLTIASAKAYDLFQRVGEVTVKVTKVGGGTVLSEQAINQDIQLPLTEAGVYKIVYTARDACGLTANVTFDATVLDVVAPQLTTTGYQEICRVGSTIQINAATATDNLDSNLAVTIYLQNSTGKYSTIEAGSMYTFEARGTYKVIYFVKDSSYNTARVCYTIKVI